MMLTTLRLDPAHPAAARDLRDICAMHATVAALCDGHTPQPRVLWAQPWPNMLVVRSNEPLRLDQGWAGYAAVESIRPWKPPVEGPHRAVLIANPVRRHQGAATYIADRSDQLTWLTEQLAPMIDGLSVEIVDGRVRKGVHRQGHRVLHRLITVRLSGEVVDAGRLADIAVKGFWRARAYGGGLSIWEATSG